MYIEGVFARNEMKHHGEVWFWSSRGQNGKSSIIVKNAHFSKIINVISLIFSPELANVWRLVTSLNTLD